MTPETHRDTIDHVAWCLWSAYPWLPDPVTRTGHVCIGERWTIAQQKHIAVRQFVGIATDEDVAAVHERYVEIVGGMFAARELLHRRPRRRARPWVKFLACVLCFLLGLWIASELAPTEKPGYEEAYRAR